MDPISATGFDLTRAIEKTQLKGPKAGYYTLEKRDFFGELSLYGGVNGWVMPLLGIPCEAI